jgi:phosphate starvation-inducible protein PhoH and related proteins
MGKPKTKRQSNVTELYQSGRNARFFDNPQEFEQSHPKTTPSGQKYRKNIEPKSDNQKVLVDAIDACDVAFGAGPAGTGKTYLAVAKGIEWLEANPSGRLILGRPAVEAGEKLGFLPGDAMEKIEPFMQPLYDVVCERISKKAMETKIRNGQICPIPIAHMRGRTFNNAFIVIDEAQNCTYSQLKMIYSRLGLGSKMVFVGDPSGHQNDLGAETGFAEFMRKLSVVETSRLKICELEEVDVVRHPLLKDTLHLL